ncbi:4Fe-4S binding protein, partial [Escherichia coli]|uniref:4Fe-4S binding protein n=1 Tax=Escherichia coli TaxID=562 RepID=UPI0023B3386C
MTTQYGFFIDSSRCTGCKTCELACKDFKDLGPEVSFRRIYEYAGGDWQEDNGVWHQNVFAYYLSGNDSNLLIVFYVQIMPDDFV